MKLKYLNSYYIPKGTIAGFPLEVIDKMLERQFEETGEVNVLKLEDAVYDCFSWSKTIEGNHFWEKVISNKDFDLH